MILWCVYPDGLRVWRDGDLVAVIGCDDFPYLIKQLADGLFEGSCPNIRDMDS